MDYVLEYMKKNDIPLTVKNYIEIAYLGDRTLADLEGEELVEVEDLVRDGELEAML